MSPTRPLSYHHQRMLRCRRALLAWLRRWGAYLSMAAVLFAAGTNSPLAVLAAAMGSLVMPLLGAVQAVQAAPHHLAAWASLLAVLALQTTIGLLPLILTRPLWWPAHWAEAERALPIAAATLRQSDRRVLAWVLGPTQALPWIGALALGLASPKLLRHGLPATLPALALCGGLSALLGSRGLSWLRARGQQPPSPLTGPRRQRITALRPQPAWRVLLWWPLTRGLARRCAHGLLMGGLATPALAAGPLSTPPADAGWWLAALAAVALGSTAWLRSRSRDELATLWQALRPLPVAWAALERQRRGLCLLPLAAGLAVALPVLASLGARPMVLTAWAAVLALAGWREAHPPPPDAAHHAVRWLFGLILVIALGSEVLP